MRWLVDIGLISLVILALPFWLPRMILRRKYRTDWPARFGQGASLDAPHARPRVLLHAVSVGEVAAIRSLVEELRSRDIEVVIATTTDTGFEHAFALFKDKCQIVRWPFDLSWCVNRFLNRVQPTVIGMVELEVWPTMTAVCRTRGIRQVVVSGRLSERSHRRYRRFRFFVQPMFSRVDAVAAQDVESAERFRDVGVPGDRVSVVGSMKWDSMFGDHDVAHKAQVITSEMGIDLDRPLIVGASTAPGEDALLDNACPEETQLLCAPRRPEWWADAADALAPCTRRSEPNTNASRNRFLLDSIGELGSLYSVADIVVIGRSFGNLHGSDPIEPVARGAAVIMGPAVSDFKFIVKSLLEAEAIIQCEAGELQDVIQKLLDAPDLREAMSEAGRAIIEKNRGATARQADILLNGLLR